LGVFIFDKSGSSLGDKEGALLGIRAVLVGNKGRSLLRMKRGFIYSEGFIENKVPFIGNRGRSSSPNKIGEGTKHIVPSA
jgi:hypothetical protein